MRHSSQRSGAWPTVQTLSPTSAGSRSPTCETLGRVTPTPWWAAPRCRTAPAVGSASRARRPCRRHRSCHPWCARPRRWWESRCLGTPVVLRSPEVRAHHGVDEVWRERFVQVSAVAGEEADHAAAAALEAEEAAEVALWWRRRWSSCGVAVQGCGYGSSAAEPHVSARFPLGRCGRPVVGAGRVPLSGATAARARARGLRSPDAPAQVGGELAGVAAIAECLGLLPRWGRPRGGREGVGGQASFAKRGSVASPRVDLPLVLGVYGGVAFYWMSLMGIV